MLKYLIITISFLMGSFRLLAQLGNPFIQTFPPSAYQSDAYTSSPQNWDIIQDSRGILYVSNTSGVLEYDGTSWQQVQGTAYEGRFQFAKNSEGKIFVGGMNDMGYLSPDSAGRMQFVSLKPYLKGKYPDIRITKTAAVGRDVYFSTDKNIFRWSGNRFKVWSSEAGFTRVFSTPKQLFTIDKAKGLCVLENDQFKALPGGEDLKTLNVTALLPTLGTTAPTPGFFVVTFDQGLYKYENQVLKKLNPTPSAVLADAYFMHGLTLADSTIALATTSEGVVIVDQEGQVKKVINKQNGLNDNTVLFLYRDQEGGLWAGLNKGIRRIDYPSPISYLNETSGLEGIVLSMLKQGNRLYAGTSSGLYVVDEKAPVPAFQKVPELQHEVWKILAVEDGLLLVSSPGVYVIAGNKVKQVSPDTKSSITYKTVHRSKSNLNKFYVGSSDGLAVITYRKGKWKWEGKIEKVNHDVIWLAEDKNGMLWATCDDNVSVVDNTKEYGLQPPVRNLKLPPNLVENLDRLQVQAIGGNIYFGTSKGIFSFQKIGDRLELKPDATFGSRFADGSREAINLTEDEAGRIWLTSEFRTGQLRKAQGKAYVWDTIPLSRIPRVDVWAIHVDTEGVVWLGTTEGIYKYDPNIPKNYKTQQYTVLRKVKLLDDSTVFHGAFSNKGKVTVAQSPHFKFVLPHAVKSISFEYAATSYDAPDQLMYSYMLEGEDKTWSHWTTETKKEFTGLDEGTYVFKVKSRNIYGTENLASTFEFVSLPPFYRTWWAYCFYVLLYGLVLWGIIKVKHRHLIASKKSLEKLVHERTAQLEAEKKKSDDLLLNILPAETAEELKANGRTLARSYDTVTVLFTDFKDFTRISEYLTPEELVAVIDFYFCAFDRIISKYNIEKIKTIGDAYMCAGGIPNPEANTPADVVKAGLEILQFVKTLNPDNKQLKRYKFEIRVGIHTGPVVAGIVGTKKFAYDIWGDTVNTAARMESCGEVGKVNVSGATYELIKDEFKCTYRGKVDAKNKGDIDMYFVEAPVGTAVLL